MKKLLVLFLCFFILAVGTLNSNTFFDLCKLFPNAKLSFYCNLETEKDFENVENLEILKTKAGDIITISACESAKIYNKIENLNGFSLKIENNLEEVQKLIENIKILKIENSPSGTIYYAFMPNLVHFCFIDGKKINLQIVINQAQNQAILGSPLILGSY